MKGPRPGTSTRTRSSKEVSISSKVCREESTSSWSRARSTRLAGAQIGARAGGHHIRTHRIGNAGEIVGDVLGLHGKPVFVVGRIQAHNGHSFRFWKKAGDDPVIRKAVLPALTRVDLEERADTQAANLSHGEKRQLEVGMALAGHPKMLLLDEPYAGMGPGGAVELTKLIRQLKTEVTILLVEHDMGAVFSLADRITVLVYGQAIASGTPDEIRTNPAVRQAYLGDEANGCSK